MKTELHALAVRLLIGWGCSPVYAEIIASRILVVPEHALDAPEREWLRMVKAERLRLARETSPRWASAN